MLAYAGMGSGLDLARAISKFSDLLLGGQLLKDIARSQYKDPTPVQQWAPFCQVRSIGPPPLSALVKIVVLTICRNHQCGSSRY